MSFSFIFSLMLTAGELPALQINTLKNAQVLYRSSQLLHTLAPACSAVAQDLAIEIGADLEKISDLPIWQQQRHAQLDVLFVAQLGIDQLKFQQMLTEFAAFSTLTPKQALPDCANKADVEDLIYKYQSSLSALQLRPPISNWTDAFNPALDQTADLEMWQQLIQQSYSIVLADVQPKSLISVQQQADYLHFHDKNDYMFVVRQGWKNLSPRYPSKHQTATNQARPTTDQSQLDSVFGSADGTAKSRAND